MFERIEDLGYLRNSLKTFTQHPSIGLRELDAGYKPPAPYGPGSMGAAPAPKGDIAHYILSRKPRSHIDRVNQVYRF